MKKRLLCVILILCMLMSFAQIGTVMAAESIFDRFIPIEQTYSAIIDTATNFNTDSTMKFTIGTQFDNEMGKWSPDTLLQIKRADYKGGYLKLKYIGNFGEIDKELADSHMCIVGSDDYTKIVNGGEGKSYGMQITKDTIVVAIDLYDANKKFVRTISPGSIIAATGYNGEFITYSRCYYKLHSIYFTTDTSLIGPDEDIASNKVKAQFQIKTAVVKDKSDMDKLLPDGVNVMPTQIEKYNYVSHPAVHGNNLNANILLSDHDFISADNTYYYVGKKDGQIDPAVIHKIDNVVCYNTYNHSIEPGYTQRNLVTADGTLYGVTNKAEKKVVATNVKKASMNHYLTNDGNVVEIKSGKTIATDCKDFAEANTAWTIGVIKNDGSFWLGYTYLGDADAYKKGLQKKLDSAKIVVPEGVVDSNNTFYRWNETVKKLGMDPNAWSMGMFVEKNEYNVDLVKVCNSASRIFPNESLTRIGITREELVHATITGFVLSEDGNLYGYGFWYDENFGKFGTVEEIFSVRESYSDGNFVGIKAEGVNQIEAIVCRKCDNERYKRGPVYDKELEQFPQFVCITRGGFLASNGRVYSFDTDTEGIYEKELWAEPNFDKDFGQMHRGTNTYKAFGFGKEETLNLLPSVYSWTYDNKSTCLLERNDGSVWMSALYGENSNPDILKSLDGFRNTNAIQVSPPTDKKRPADYISVSAGSGAQTQASAGFNDVKADAYYASSVGWAVANKITSGTSQTTFSPDNTCTRAQILTFLWRAVGSPKSQKANPFADVKQSDYFYDAALWAYDKGMVSGNAFEGNTPCTRSATVTYLWKNAGSPKASYKGNFTDVGGSSEYASAVAWAVANSITSGTSQTTFSPENTCTRGQIVTFLMRALNK